MVRTRLPDDAREKTVRESYDCTEAKILDAGAVDVVDLSDGIISLVMIVCK